MTNLRVITVRGTGEVQHGATNMLMGVVAGLHGPFQYQDLDYPATISFANAERSLFGIAGDRSVFLGVQQLRETLRTAADEDRFVLLGYSLGALIVSELVASSEVGLLSKVVAIGQVADPLRPAGDSFGRPAHQDRGFGLAGQRKARETDPPILQIANPADFICSAASNSLMRPFVEEILAFSVRDPGPAAAKFFSDLVSGKNEVPIQALLDGRLEQTFRDLRGYMGEEHTIAYTRPDWRCPDGDPFTGLDLLAAGLNRHIAQLDL